MASFVPNHSKKIERLQRLEKDMRRLIDSGVNREKLLNAALQIREGRIRVLLAKQNENRRNTTDKAAFLKDKENIKKLRELTAEMVLAEYLPNLMDDPLGPDGEKTTMFNARISNSPSR